MAWRRSNSGESGSSHTDASAALLNPLLSAHDENDNDDDDDMNSTTATIGTHTPPLFPAPAPISGAIPSPASGIVHQLGTDGVNHVTVTSPSTNMRHRAHNQHSQQQRQLQRQLSTPPPVITHSVSASAASTPTMHSFNSDSLYMSQSLDDADAAAGMIQRRPTNNNTNHNNNNISMMSGGGGGSLLSSTTTPGSVRSEPKSRRSNSHPTHTGSSRGGIISISSPRQYFTPNKMKPSMGQHQGIGGYGGGSRSVGSKTPEVTRTTMNSTFRHSTGSGHGNQYNHDQQQQQQQLYTANNFFNQPIPGAALPPPPNAQHMDRGITREQQQQENLLYNGGSEHDFLALHSTASSVNNNIMMENDDNASITSSQAVMMMPPLEISTNTSNDRMGSRATTSYPPYGLPTIEGSPSITTISLASQQQQSSMSSLTMIPPPTLNEEHESLLQQQQHEQPTSESQSKSKFIVLGYNLSSYTRQQQFLISASGTFFFSLLYGYLQELIAVELCHRKLGLFLAAQQFMGYTILSYFFRQLDNHSSHRSSSSGNTIRRLKNWGRLRGKIMSEQQQSSTTTTTASSSSMLSGVGSSKLTVPLELYIGLSILRAIDLGMTNLAMQYVNYPAKTLMKSTRVVFTMIFGVIVTKKRYGAADFGIVGLMVAGLGMFMHADAKTSAVFQPLGIIMLTISLLCDGAISNLSEALMNQYDVGQDEFIFRLYSVATLFICIAAAVKGDLRDGLAYLTQSGTLKEMEEGLDPTWSISGKIITMVLFSTTGFLGSSTSAAITKSFGALTMSITSTARKATTIFLSFVLFPNECTLEHICGIVLFIASLVAKSLRASRRSKTHHSPPRQSRRSQRGNRGAPIIEIASSKSTDASDSLLHSRRKAYSGDNAV